MVPEDMYGTAHPDNIPNHLQQRQRNFLASPFPSFGSLDSLATLAVLSQPDLSLDGDAGCINVRKDLIRLPHPRWNNLSRTLRGDNL
ncbi:hypothetical protein VTO42DRAFT_2792 [Malbranchea cinnamomea]